MEVGLNLYSVRNYLDTEENFLKVSNELREMGYSYMQYSGGKFDGDKIRRVSEASHMPVVLTHAPKNLIFGGEAELDELMAAHDKFGCKYIGLGSVKKELVLDVDECRKMIETLERSAKYLEAHGYKLFYHNHNFEFYRHGDKTVFDMLIEEAPHLHFTLDTYWVQYGGGDVLATIDRLRGRIECMHLKDYMNVPKMGEKLKFEPVYAPVGDGTLNFAAIVEHARAAGTEYFLVEQDNAAVLPDTLEQIARSVRYIKSNL